ncbi:MAG: hypothetical protein ABR999_02145 [Methanoregula sp.]|uniref:hypothetical protein n=1 Tax=Methanoregula sp. TaxID=2052170 RepID=UPI003D11F595
MELKGTLVNQSLIDKGFKAKEGSKHIFYQYYSDGKKTIMTTFMSRPPSPIGDKLISKMATQTKLSRPQFIDLVKCPLTKEGLREIYEKKELL